MMNNKVDKILVLALLVVSGCMATRFSNVWKDESVRKGPIKNVLVIALLPSPERSRMVEDEMAKQLKSRGVTSVLSYVEFAGKLPAREEVLSRLGKFGVDSVLVSKFAGKETKSYQDYPDDYKAVLKQWDESGMGVSHALAVPAGERQTYALMSTSLYDAETQKIIWSALTETWVVGMDSRLTSSFVSTVLDRLAEDKFIR
ncbi:hypothetical protein NBG4_950003 [Candidatus Sulfobium mesophilum]|uniref:Lipoprotein n=1 Tax=Candidatus Sulfobium mesophilum TaxID=2016548 RepID=A0A2U3QL84_9BACT|nr:hypothetical protein NBG4_950003 [Candidatus Sulfobium mesophilum]